MTRRRTRARKSRSSDSSLSGFFCLCACGFRRTGLSRTEPLTRLGRSSSPGALGKGSRRHGVCRRGYHCPVAGCPLNRSRRCTRSRVPPSASLCSRSCGCHFPLRRGALAARLIGACGPRHLKVESHEEIGRKACRVVDLSFSHLWRAARAKPGSRMPTSCGRMVTRRRFLANEAESKSSTGFCRDGVQAARDARGAVAETRDVQTLSSGVHR
jgi:hypothetical protein